MSEVRIIKINTVKPNKYQPRLDFYDEGIKNLAASIKENGLIHPIVVRETNDGYEIIAGERRYRASKYLGLEEIEAIIVDKDDEESANLALIENMQREDLSAIEEAIAIQKIMQSRKMTQAEIAKQLGYRQSTIANKLRLLKLPDYIQVAVAKGEITERHARAMLKVSEDKLEEVFNVIIQRGYNVKRTEEYIKALNDKNKSKIRGVSSSIRLGLNTIKESYELCRKTGLDADYQVTDYENEVKVVIRFKKQG
jgi:ParB family chromosome partitioning protein